MCKSTEQHPPPSPSPCGEQKTHVLLDGRKRRVSFGTDIVHVFEKDYSRRDHAEIWYNFDELQDIKSEIYAIIRFANMRQNRALNSKSMVTEEIDKILDQYHWRGLDHIQNRRPRKDIRKRHARDTVNFRKYTHCTDPVQLAIYAANNTKGSCQIARELAIADERDAFVIHGRDTTIKEQVPILSNQPSVDPKIGSVAGMSICRGEGTQITATGIQSMSTVWHSGGAEKDTASASLLVTSYNMVSMLLPCMC